MPSNDDTDTTFRRRNSVNKDIKPEPNNTIESLFLKALEKLIDRLRVELDEEVKKRITIFKPWDEIDKSDKRIIIEKAADILSAEEKGYAGDLNVFIQGTWPHISDPNMFESFKQTFDADNSVYRNDVGQFIKREFNPADFGTALGTPLGSKKRGKRKRRNSQKKKKKKKSKASRKKRRN